MTAPRYIVWLSEDSSSAFLPTGEKVNVFSLNHTNEDAILDEWSKHISEHYISNTEAELDAKELKLTKSEYLFQYFFDLEPKDISGNFAEILFADFIEHILHFLVPRYKLYGNFRGNPQQGIDLFGFRFSRNPMEFSKDDEICFMEVKAALSKNDFSTIESAVKQMDSRTEEDCSLLLNHARKKLKLIGRLDEANMISRFQCSDIECKRRKSAGAVISSSGVETTNLIGIKIEIKNEVQIFAIHGDELYNLAKDLYKRACK